jgi:aspartate/methionine/tyrosine aminotransferase
MSCGPDKFMFDQFKRHAAGLKGDARRDYFMLSAGANLLPMPKVLRQLAHLELEHPLAYQWYTSATGFPMLLASVCMFANVSATGRVFPRSRPFNGKACMTFGASQAVSKVFDFVKTFANRKPSVLIVGMNYGLFERLADHFDFIIEEVLSAHDVFDLPGPEAVIDRVRRERPDLLVITAPNNPTGQSYSQADIQTIIRYAAEQQVLVLIDEVGQMPVAQKNWLNVAKAVVEADALESVVIVNSFSKSESVPGIRMGYLLGPRRITEFVAARQHVSSMNPSTYPMLPFFAALLFRSVWAHREIHGLPAETEEAIRRYSAKMFDATTVLAPEKIRSCVQRLCGGDFEAHFQAYLADQQDTGAIIERNWKYAVEVLQPWFTRVSRPASGMNGMVELAPFDGHDENVICERLIAGHGIAVLTEGCFRVSARQRSNFGIRLSLAAPPEEFQRAVNALGALASSTLPRLGLG